MKPRTLSKFSIVAITAICISCILIYSCRKTESFKSVVNDHLVSSAVNGLKPNIVLILLDDIGSEVPTCYGGQSYETPNIDMLAQKGMRFTQCYGSPVCSPSRFMMM